MIVPNSNNYKLQGPGFKVKSVTHGLTRHEKPQTRTSLRCFKYAVTFLDICTHYLVLCPQIFILEIQYFLYFNNLFGYLSTNSWNIWASLVVYSSLKCNLFVLLKNTFFYNRHLTRSISSWSIFVGKTK